MQSMQRGFWAKLKKPFFALAPMANVTDLAFRHLVAKYAKPDVFWTEFVACDGLCSRGREKLLPDLRFDKSERPIVAQIFGANPEHFEECAKLVRELGFDGLDINMGCPDKAVEKQGAGAALIKNPKLATQLILAAKRGAGKMPVSVKTRIGYSKDILEEWLPYILEAEPAAITIHARTRKEMSDVPAHWDAVSRAVKLVRRKYPRGARPLVIGNGDVGSLKEARARAKETGADGIMIGRGVFGNPWFFDPKRRREPDLKERMQALLEHVRLFEDFHKAKNFDIMKKHFKAYASGFPGAKELRIRLMAAHDPMEVEDILSIGRFGSSRN